MADRMETEDVFIYGDSDGKDGNTTDASIKSVSAGAGDEDSAKKTRSGNGNKAISNDMPEYSDLEDNPDDKDERMNSSSDGPDANEGGDASDSGSGSSDDEDIEIILEPGGVDANKHSSTEDMSITEKVGDRDGTVLDGTDDQIRAKDGSIQALLAGGVDRLDMVTVPLINGLDMFKIDLDMLDEKPWRQPGADITDYFNFGFNEETWKLYCLKQRHLRAEFNVRKMMPPAMMMMQGNPGMPMANPAMYSAMMNQGFRPEMAGGMFPPYMRPGQGQQVGGNSGANGGDTEAGQDRTKDGPQSSQGKDGSQQQQQMRMDMPPGYFPGHNFPQGMGGPQHNMPMGAMTPQMQMQMQMQMNGRMPMPPNPQAMHQRPGPSGTGNMPRPQNPAQMSAPQHSRDADLRDKIKDGDSGRPSSHRRDSHERSESRHRNRDKDSTGASSMFRHERNRDSSRQNRDSSRSTRDKSVADQRRSDRRHERSRDREPRDRDGRESKSSRTGEKSSDRRSQKRRRSPSKEKETSSKSASRRRR
ncbi:cleavage polyadenylation factor subunit fip1 [Coemansia sp. RSA 1933]|nr:cleavage polyadenylation factor subunit fip1 [Coemansia sp. RSA 1933]